MSIYNFNNFNIPLQYVIYSPYSSNCNFSNCNSVPNFLNSCIWNPSPNPTPINGTPCYSSICGSNPCCTNKCFPTGCGNSSCGSTCSSPCPRPSPSPCTGLPYCYNNVQSVYYLTLTFTSLCNYTFVIKQNSLLDPTITTQIAQGTAILSGNILLLTFLDSNQEIIGNGVISYSDCSGQGSFLVTGSISCTFPGFYNIYPFFVCSSFVNCPCSKTCTTSYYPPITNNCHTCR